MTPPERAGGGLTARGLAWVYRGVVGLRNRLYDDPRRIRCAGVPVLSVGNLTVGGTGKTPLVAWLALGLLSGGRRPAVVSRGYRGRAGRGPVVVSTGEGPLVDADLCGDEPWLLARALPGALVVVGSERLRGAVEAERLGADCVILDDGFQHRRLSRELDIVLLDSSDPWGGGRLLPAGRMREPLGGLARADVVIVTRTRPGDRFTEIEAVVRSQNARALILTAGHRPRGFVDSSGQEAPRPGRVVAFCGIGNPGSFRSDLEACGCEIVTFRAYRDHHEYGDGALGRLRREAESTEATLVTTEKDLVRLAGRASVALPGLLALRIAAVVYDPDPLERAVAAALASDRGQGSPGKEASD